jgi:hypothetical protein
MEINPKYLTPVKKIFLGVLIYVIAGLIYSVVNPLHSLKLGWIVAVESFYYTTVAAIVVGCVFALIGLNGFKNVVENADQKAAKLVYTGYIIFLASVFLNITFISEWVIDVFALVSAIILIIGYSKLKKSEILNKEMKDGFSILFLAAVFILIGACFNLIPVAGKILWATKSLWAIFNFSSLIITLIGWNKVKRGAVKAR